MKNNLAWAHAIYMLAKEENQLPQYKEDAHFFLTSIASEPAIIKYLQDPFITIKDKEDFLNELFQTKTYLTNLMLLLVKEHQIKHVGEILNKFIRKYNKEHHIKEGIIWTVNKLDQALEKEIEAKFSKKYPSQKIEFTTKIDKDLIGGFKVEIDQDVYDLSIKNELTNIKKELLKE